MRPIYLTKIMTDRYNDNEEGEGQQGSPVTINVDAIRCFYPRRNNQPGTRITFTDGGGFVVCENYETVKAMASGISLFASDDTTVVNIAS